MRKKMILILCILLAAALLVPLPRHLKDGGTVEYRAVLYSVQKVRRLNAADAEKPYLEGVVVEILGIEIFNNVQ